MDSYQPIYDAVRSRISSCDPERIIRDAVSGLDASNAIYLVQSAFQEAAWAAASPSAIYRPQLSIDGNKWCALYGANLMEGVAGFGDSPALAMADFDKNWNAKIGAQA
jgi:hypothetical protein